MIDKDRTEKFCEVDDQLFVYDICVSPEYYELYLNRKDLIYIGEGKIWSINGVLQHGERISRFYSFK